MGLARYGRAAGLADLAQAALWGVAAGWLWPRWAPAAGVAGVGALLMAVGGAALLAGRGGALARRTSMGALLCAAVLVGAFAQSAAVIATRFGADARDLGLATFGGSLAALPWLIGLPLWRVFGPRPPGSGEAGSGGAGAAGLALLAGGLGAATVAGLSRPAMAWEAQPALVEAAAAARARWMGDLEAEIPVGQGPVVALLTPWSGGRPTTGCWCWIWRVSATTARRR